MSGVPKTILPDLSMMPAENIREQAKIVSGILFPSIKSSVARQTVENYLTAASLVPGVEASITSGRVIDTVTLENLLFVNNIPISSYENPWPTDMRDAYNKFIIEKPKKGIIKSALTATMEFLLHVDPEKQNEIIYEAVQSLPVGFRFKMDSLQFIPGLEAVTLKNLQTIKETLPENVPLQVLVEPNIEAFQTIDAWENFMVAFNRKNEGKIQLIASMDMPNLHMYKKDGTSLDLLEHIISQGFKIDIGAIEVSGYDEDGRKNHSEPWKLPQYDLRKLFLVMKRNRIDKIYLETDARIIRELFAGLPEHYVKVMEQVFNN